MPLFTWKTDYSVNMETLDNHHRTLFDIVNKLYDDCLKTDNINCVDVRIKELIAYSDYHFAEEEQYMQQSGFPEIDAHIKMHKAFRAKISELQQANHDSQSDLTRELIVFLGNWLLHHVLEEDKKYS